MRIRYAVRGLAPIAPGFYRDPGGAGIREWTGIEWSPFLHNQPVESGSAAVAESAPTWSPLPSNIQEAAWDLAIKAYNDAPDMIFVIGVLLFCALLSGFCTLLVAVADPDPQAPVVVGMFALLTVAFLAPALVMIRNRRARRRIAEAAQAARALARAED